MMSVLTAVLLAMLVFAMCAVTGLPASVAIVAAVLVLLAGVGTGGHARSGWGGR